MVNRRSAVYCDFWPHMIELSNWEQATVSLTFRLGEITLLSLPFSGLSNREHFTAVSSLSHLPTPPPHLSADVNFLFYPTYPVVSPPRPIAYSDQWLLYTPYTFTNSYVDFQRLGCFDNYLSTLSAKSRSTLQRKVRKLADANGGQVHWRQFTRSDEMDEFFSLARRVSALTYQERLLGSGLPTSTDFAIRAKERAANHGAYGYILFLHEKAIAYVFCFCTDGIVTYDYVGYDPAVARLSAGSVLQYLILQALFEQTGIRVFDFTEGEGAHKTLFSTDARLCAKTYCFKRTLRTLFLVYLHYSLNRFVAGIGRQLDKLGLKTRIRNLIRRSA